MRNFNPFNGLGAIGNTSDLDTVTGAGNRFASVLSQIIGVLTAIAALWFVFKFLIGSIRWLSAGSDKQALENAKKDMLNAFVGLFLVIIAYALVGVVGYFFGIDIINITELINQAGPR